MMEYNHSEIKSGKTVRCKCRSTLPRSSHAFHQDQSYLGKRAGMHRNLSLTDVERVVLSRLFVDGTCNKNGSHHTKILTDEMLLSSPFVNSGNELNLEKTELHNEMFSDSEWAGTTAAPQTTDGNITERRTDNVSTLWGREELGHFVDQQQRHLDIHLSDLESQAQSGSIANRLGSVNDSDKTDITVQDDQNDGSGSSSSLSSHGDDEIRQYDSWQVLQDEYARDFGFDYKPDVSGEVCDENSQSFKIIGTSTDDIAAQPHVLSPPIMESLLSFVPDTLSCENFWLKYSLVRDGANIDTFRNYTRAAAHTILAIQTSNGEVFGSFTSSAWQIGSTYFGSGESFVWRMRHNRMDTCYSLYEKAQLESEIDIYPYSSLNSCVQLCKHDMLGVGAGEIQNKNIASNFVEECRGNEELGFAFVLQSDFLTGTTSQVSNA
uniref:Oxidation resistance protein 1 n=1 Tax=Chaetoceros debilis TaxID=122233 RepID=A0A7S3QCD2_9STRA